MAVRKKALFEKRIIISFDKDYLKSVEREEKASVLVLNLPRLKPEEIIFYMDKIINAASQLKRKKKPFVASYSEAGLEIVDIPSL